MAIPAYNNAEDNNLAFIVFALNKAKNMLSKIIIVPKTHPEILNQASCVIIN